MVQLLKTKNKDKSPELEEKGVAFGEAQQDAPRALGRDGR